MHIKASYRQMSKAMCAYFTTRPALLATSGWAIGAVTLLLSWSLGGLTTGLALRLRYPTLPWKHVFMIAFGWLLAPLIAVTPFIIFFLLLLFLWASSDSVATGAVDVEVLGVTLLFCLSLGAIMGWGVAGAIGGYITAWIIRRQAPSLQQQDMRAIARNWAISLWLIMIIPICTYAFTPSSFSHEVGSAGVFSIAIRLGIGGAIGSTSMFRQLDGAGGNIEYLFKFLV